MTTHTQDRTRILLEPAAGKSDGSPTSGVQCDLSAVDEAMPLPLPRTTRVLPHVEWIALELSNPELGG